MRPCLVIVLLLGTLPAAASPESERLRQEGNDATLAMRYSDALSLYSRALAAAPEQAGLHYSLARVHQFLGEFPEALSELERFVKDATPQDKARVGKLDELFAQLRPRVSTLQLTCDVAGARVLVRDRVVGTTPLPPIALSSGASTVSIELEGFFSERRDVVLPGGGTLAMKVVLSPKSTRGFLSVKTTPQAADVAVDGHAIGTTSPGIELALPAGAHEVFARKAGYHDAKVPIVLVAGDTRELVIPLARRPPLYTRWWLWTTVGAVVAGGVVAAVLLTNERSAGHGTLPPGQVRAP